MILCKNKIHSGKQFLTLMKIICWRNVHNLITFHLIFLSEVNFLLFGILHFRRLITVLGYLIQIGFKHSIVRNVTSSHVAIMVSSIGTRFGIVRITYPWMCSSYCYQWFRIRNLWLRDPLNQSIFKKCLLLEGKGIRWFGYSSWVCLHCGAIGGSENEN